MRLIVLAVLLLPAVAAAYPQFQLSLGVDRCETCHLPAAAYSPRTDVTKRALRSVAAATARSFTARGTRPLGLLSVLTFGSRPLIASSPTITSYSPFPCKRTFTCAR
jgi:hypothetical protein